MHRVPRSRAKQVMSTPEPEILSQGYKTQLRALKKSFANIVEQIKKNYADRDHSSSDTRAALLSELVDISATLSEMELPNPLDSLARIDPDKTINLPLNVRNYVNKEALTEQVRYLHTCVTELDTVLVQQLDQTKGRSPAAHSNLRKDASQWWVQVETNIKTITHRKRIIKDSLYRLSTTVLPKINNKLKSAAGKPVKDTTAIHKKVYKIFAQAMADSATILQRLEATRIGPIQLVTRKKRVLGNLPGNDCPLEKYFLDVSNDFLLWHDGIRAGTNNTELQGLTALTGSTATTKSGVGSSTISRASASASSTPMAGSRSPSRGHVSFNSLVGSSSLSRERTPASVVSLDSMAFEDAILPPPAADPLIPTGLPKTPYPQRRYFCVSYPHITPPPPPPTPAFPVALSQPVSHRSQMLQQSKKATQSALTETKKSSASQFASSHSIAVSHSTAVMARAKATKPSQTFMSPPPPPPKGPPPLIPSSDSDSDTDADSNSTAAIHPSPPKKNLPTGRLFAAPAAEFNHKQATTAKSSVSLAATASKSSTSVAATTTKPPTSLVASNPSAFLTAPKSTTSMAKPSGKPAAPARKPPPLPVEQSTGMSLRRGAPTKG